MHQRDFIGYANRPPKLRWPNGAGLTVNFVLNYEEGTEYSIGDGDGRSETALIEVNQPRVPQGERDLASESMYEYGSRVGYWRLGLMEGDIFVWMLSGYFLLDIKQSEFRTLNENEMLRLVIKQLPDKLRAN